MADIIRYVDPDATGAGTGVDWANAYNSLQAAEAAEQTNLVTAQNTMTFECRASGGSLDTNQVYFLGWTVNNTYFITIKGDVVSPKFDTNKYTLRVGSTNQPSLSIRQDWTVVKNIQIEHNNSLGGAGGIECLSSHCTIDGNIIRKWNVGAFGQGLDVAGFQKTGNVVKNNVVYDLPNEGIYFDIASTNNNECYNNTVHNCGIGIKGNNAVNLIVENNIVFGCTDDFEDSTSGTWALDHNASDDGDGANPVSPRGLDWTNEFIDYMNDDFTLKSDGNCENGGKTIASVTIDIAGTNRPQSSAYDIGAFELPYIPPVDTDKKNIGLYQNKLYSIEEARRKIGTRKLGGYR